MKVFIHSAWKSSICKEIDSYPLAFSVEKSQFYMELSPPYAIYANPNFSPIALEFSQNGFDVYFSEESIALEFFAWLQQSNKDAREYFCNMPD